MRLGFVPLQRRRAPQQQAVIRRPLDQAKEVLGRMQRVVDAQQPPLICTPQQRFHRCQHALGPGFVKVFAKAWVQAALGHDQAAELHRLIATDQCLETTGNGQQYLLHRRPFGVLEQQVGQL